MFTSEEFESAYPPGIEEHYWNRARNDILERKILKYTGMDRFILDIGCGRGLTVDYLCKRSFRCYGSDLAPVSVPSHLSDVIFTGRDAFSLDRGFREKVNTILLLDVVEHSADPGSFLQNCILAFPALRHVFITVPARMELWSNYD